MPHPLDALFQTILARKTESAEKSYTASLFAKGSKHIAKKIGEEATETAVEVASGNKEKIASESADLLYHLLVAWAEAGLTPEDIYKVLESRTHQSGIEEKNSRKQ